MEAILGLRLTVNSSSSFANDHDQDARSWMDSAEIIDHLYFALVKGRAGRLFEIDCNLCIHQCSDYFCYIVSLLLSVTEETRLSMEKSRNLYVNCR